MDRFENGKLFDSYEVLQEYVYLYEKENFVSLYKKKSRKIETARKRGPNKNFKESLVYSEIVYACSHNGKYTSKATTGTRPNQKTGRIGCPMVIKLRSTKDGQHLMVTSFKEEHNHAISEIAFMLHPTQRKIDKNTEEEVSKLCQLQAKRKLIRTYITEETGKHITLKDIHNIAAKGKVDNNATSAVKDLASWLKSEYPALETEFLLDENNVIVGLYLQDAEIKDTFNKFPELILVDSTHKTNDRGMPFFVVMGIDGQGESQVVAAFVLQQEDGDSLRKMVQIFKEKNPRWKDIRVVISDKDLTERTVFKSELPQIDLQICLFHVLRTFGREITTEKIDITVAQCNTILDSIQNMVYARSASDYLVKYDEFCALCPNTNVRLYFDSNWHTIRHQWVEGLKSQQLNFNTSTNNRLESFFQKLKSVLPHKGSVKDLLSAFCGLLVTLRTERHYRAVTAVSKVSTTQITSEALIQFGSVLTSYALGHVSKEYNSPVLTSYALGQVSKEYNSPVLTSYALGQVSKEYNSLLNVKVCSESTAETSTGIVNVTPTSCECSFFVSMNLPCRHIFAILQHNHQPLFCPDVVHERWTKTYNLNFSSAVATPSTLQSLSNFTPSKRVLGYNDKFRKAALITQQLASVLACNGTELFHKRLQIVQEVLNYFKQDKDMLIIENVILQENITSSPEYIDAPSTTEDISSTSQEILSTSSIQSALQTATSIKPSLPSVASHNDDENAQDITGNIEQPDMDPLSLLENATLPIKCKKRGRPKGAVKTAIGLQRQLLAWYISEDCVNTAIAEIKIKETDVEVIPENIPSCSMDETVDINCVKKFFEEDAWTCVLHVRTQRRQLVWDCIKCAKDVHNGDQVICCECCLSWLHFKCAKI